MKLREVFTYLEYNLLAGWFWMLQKAVNEKKKKQWMKRWKAEHSFLLVCGTRGKKKESETQGEEMSQVNVPISKSDSEGYALQFIMNSK